MVSRSRGSLALTVAIALAALWVASGTASATGLETVYGFQTPDGHFVLPYYQGLLSANSVSPGSTVFGDTMYLEVTPNGNAGTVTVTTNQTASGATALLFNESFSIDAHNVTTLTLQLPSSTEQRNVKLCVDGGCMAFLHLTPLTLIPSGLLNIGGLDLLVLAISVETAVLLFPLTTFAYWLTRKALWSPRFRAWLWMPHIVGGILIGVVADYQLFDTLFGGVGFLFIPVAFAVTFFGWTLHLFNTAKPVEVLRPDPQGGHRLRYNRWRIWVGELPDGNKILIGTRWRDWLARLFGHYPIIVPANIDGTKVGQPAEADVFTLRTEAGAWERKDRRVKRARLDGGNPLADFVVTGAADSKERDPPALLWWVDSDGWLTTRMPRLSIHRDVRVPAKMAPDGITVVEAATTKRKFAWPHYVDPPSEASIAGFHYLDAPAAALGWVSVERLLRRLKDLRINLTALRSTIVTESDDLAEIQVAETFRLLMKERLPLTDAEAAEETRNAPPKAGPAAPPDNPDARPPKMDERRGGRANA